MIFVDDHPPAHVHARGKGVEIIFWLNCPDGPVQFREAKGSVLPADQRAIEDLLNDNLNLLCERWSEIDDQR